MPAYARWLCGTLSCLLLCAASSSGETLIQKSLNALSPSSSALQTSFDFVVTGDSQSNRQLVFQTDLFKQMIREWNSLKPALVVEVGDLILGGSAENVPPQWDLFQQTVAECRVPYFPVPGNHDISDAATERLWLERMGPTRYAFSYGNSRFIVLDSEEVDAPDRLSEEQLAWMKNELANTKADNIFVFLHQPYFTSYSDPGKMDETWERRWKYLAELFRGHPVRAVFAGHRHGYQDFGVREGVHYVIAAGGAALGNGPEELGRFSHYLLVHVRGEDVGWSVVKPGAILPSDVATNDRSAELFDIKHRLVACDEVAAPYGQTLDRDIAIHVENPFDKPFDSAITWETREGWTVEPLVTDYHVAAHGKVDLNFHVRVDNPEKLRFPVPAFKTHYPNTRFGSPVDISSDLPLVPVTEAEHAPDEIRVDGALDEWDAATPIALSYPGGFEQGRYDPADLSGQCRVLWDDKNLYLAFEITDNEHFQPYAGDIVWLNDAIELGIDDWAWGISLTQAGPEVFLYEGPGMSAETVNKDVRLAVRREPGRTIYEAAFPAALVQPLQLQAASEFHFRAQVADRDGNGSGAKHELSLTPGGGSAPRVKVLLKP